MRIQNNITAINAHRNYSINNASIAKSVEKLSSGYRINRAGDDAAGLAISEKMRAQIRGLNMASKNSQDAVSLIQTAEGALQSTHDILQRMRELSVQSASDTNEKIIDRGALEQEFQALKAEVNDIAAKTRFNDQNLIDGTFSKFQVSMGGTAAGAALANTMGLRVSATGKEYGSFAITVVGTAASATTTSAGTAAVATHSAAGTGTNTAITTIAYTGPETSAYNANKYTLQVDDQGDNNLIFRLVDSESNTVATSATVDISTWAVGANKISMGEYGSFSFTKASSTDAQVKADLLSQSYNGGTWTFSTAGKDPTVTPAKAATASMTINGETQEIKLGDTSVTFKNSGITLYFDGGIRDDDLGTAGKLVANVSTKTVIVNALKGNSLTIQTGANQGDEVSINIDKMNANSLGIGGSSIATRTMASNAITEVNDALNAVSTQRAALGALQNRMEFKIANLDTSAENLQAAESRIRDVDMAAEMTKFSKQNILAQASTAMLAQANALPQGVLQLLG